MISLLKCPYDEVNEIHDCTETTTYNFAIGLRQQCKHCTTYHHWRHAHKKELRALRRERLALYENSSMQKEETP